MEKYNVNLRTQLKQHTSLMNISHGHDYLEKHAPQYNDETQS